jgi:hypothetical protein
MTIGVFKIGQKFLFYLKFVSNLGEIIPDSGVFGLVCGKQIRPNIG